MSIDIQNMTCWIITEDLAGTRNQCIGVAQALGVHPVVKTITLKQPWKTLSPWLGFEQSWSFKPRLHDPWPDLLLTSGRKAVAAARYIKKASGGKTFTVHIQDPRINPACFDLLAVPEHDPTRGPNVITTRAAPNRINAEALIESKKQFKKLEQLKSPRVAVLIGGNSKAYKLTPQITKELCDKLLPLDAGLMISTSRRTGEKNTQIIRDRLTKENTYIWDGNDPNPYFSMLAWADFILVTADSVSMLSEACTTGKPVYMISLDGGAPRIDKLHANLQKSGALRIFDGTLEHWSYEPLNDAQYITEEIKKRLRDKE